MTEENNLNQNLEKPSISPENQAKGEQLDSLTILGKKEEVKEKKNSWGGHRENAGRHIGDLNKSTLEKKAVLQEIKERVMKHAHELFESQLNIAKGCSYLFRIDDIDLKSQKRRHALVIDPLEIKRFLDGELDSTKYYYITTKSPDSKAIDSLLDRTFGRAVQYIDLDPETSASKLAKLEEDELNNQIEQLESEQSNTGGEKPVIEKIEGGETPTIGK